MTVRLPCPTCSRPLWVRIGTAGGHHTEAWPAHECVAPADVASPAAPPEPAPPPLCSQCGERGPSTPLAQLCQPCRKANQLAATRAWQRRRGARKRAAKRCVDCGASLADGAGNPRRCFPCGVQHGSTRLRRSAGVAA